MSIFVQIASYRDPELKNTIRSLLKNADHPESLTVCIAWQHHSDDEWDNLDEFGEDPRFIIIDMDAKESRGACWARHAIQQKYAGQKYTLQLDSHHRFAQHWDTACIVMLAVLEARGHAKPVLTAYVPPYDPEDDPAKRTQEIYKINFDKFCSDGSILTRPGFVSKPWPKEPFPARFYSAHFTFAPGSFCTEVMHDPELYFTGEEITIMVRGFTKGYDFFHPNRLVAWHEYTRKNRTKHWDDGSKWQQYDAVSKKRVRVLLGMEDGSIDFGEYGLGDVRSLSDFEAYSGVTFKTKSVSKHARDFKDPPGPPEPAVSECTHWLRWMVEVPQVIRQREQEIDFVAEIIESEDGSSLKRVDEPAAALVRAGTVTFRYEGSQMPSRWVVWPHSKSGTWLEKCEGRIDTV